MRSEDLVEPTGAITRKYMLNNIDITSLIAGGELVLNHAPSRIQPASYDLVIGTIFRDRQIINSTHLRAKDPIEIAPGEVVTMLSLEELKLPPDICGTAYAMNAQSSEGLLVLNPGHIDPGFKGPLTIVALNLRKVPIALQLGDPIFTVVFSRLANPASPAYASSGSSRDDVERRANKKVVEKSVASLQHLLLISEADINRLIRTHWLSWIVLTSTIVAAATGVASVIFAIMAIFPTSKSESHTKGDTDVSVRIPVPPMPNQGPLEPKIVPKIEKSK